MSDLKIVEYDSRSRHRAVSGGWCDGRFYCEVELTYDNDGSELWLTVEGVRSSCGEWTMERCELEQIDIRVRGSIVGCEPKDTFDCPDGEWFFDHEIVREAMESRYEYEQEAAKERMLGVD